MRYRTLRKITEPTTEPLSVAEAKQHLRVEHSDDDTTIGELIVAAREYVENYLDCTLLVTQWKMTLDMFPPAIELPRSPLSSVSSYDEITVTYTTDTEQMVTLSSSDYRIDRYAVPAVLRPLYGDSWPSHLADYNSIAVTFWAGYGTASSDVPQRIRNAMLMLITHLYENRSSVQVGTVATVVPDSMRMLLDSVSFGGYV
jgi:uncharacterized phiE125 gp8 family phage protein